MTTIQLVEENAFRILSVFERRNLRPSATLHYSGLFHDCRSPDLQLKEFREALNWLTDRGYLDIPRMPVDSYMLTENGFRVSETMRYPRDPAD